MSPPTDRRALRSVAAQFFANGIVYASFVPRLPEIRDRVGITIGALGIVLMLGSVAGVVASFLTGPAIGAFGTRRVIVASAVLSIASLPVIGFARAPGVLVAGLVGVYFFDVFVDVAMNVQGSVLSHRRHAPVMNRLHGLWSLATVVGGLLTAAAVAAGVSVPVYLTAVALVLLVVVAAVAPGLLPVDEPHDRLDAATPTPEEDPAVVPGGPMHLGPTVAPDGDGAEGDRRVASTTESRQTTSRRLDRRRVAIALGLGGASAMTLELSAGDWAAFRLGDDLGASGQVAAAGFVAFTIGMTSGRLGGDAVQLRIGVERLLVLASVLAGIGLAVAELAPLDALVLAGFLVAGLGVSVLFPQLYDAAARAPGPPGSGFTSMLIGQRTAALLTPLAIGALAGTSALGVGDAMAIVSLPAAALSLALAVGRRRAAAAA